VCQLPFGCIVSLPAYALGFLSRGGQWQASVQFKTSSNNFGA
jgi:hypothetical protein